MLNNEAKKKKRQNLKSDGYCFLVKKKQKSSYAFQSFNIGVVFCYHIEIKSALVINSIPILQ